LYLDQVKVALLAQLLHLQVTHVLLYLDQVRVVLLERLHHPQEIREQLHTFYLLLEAAAEAAVVGL
jgi:hypothetical protein